MIGLLFALVVVVNADSLESALEQSDTVVLPAGSVLELDRPVGIPAGKTLTTDASNPATIKRCGNVSRLLTPTGPNVTISNVKIDWNFDGVYRPFSTLISISPQPRSGIEPGNPSGLRIENVEFFCSNDFGQHNGSDCWAVSMTAGTRGTIENIAILGCRSVGEFQLVGNGTIDGTLRNVRIAGCYVDGAKANAIAISSLAKIDAGNGETIFENLRIYDNTIRSASSIGIFVGQDGSAAGGAVVIRGLHIERNLIHLAPTGKRFPIGVLVRAGTADGYDASVTVSGNVFDLDDTAVAGKNPRAFVMQPQTKSDLLFSRNIRHGLGGVFVSDSVSVDAANNVIIPGGADWEVNQ